MGTILFMLLLQPDMQGIMVSDIVFLHIIITVYIGWVYWLF